MLSDIQARKAKAQDKPYKLSDEKGLYLYIVLRRIEQRGANELAHPSA